MSSTSSLGLYVHVPFCAKVCDYCAFYKERADRSQIELYLDAVMEELKRFPPEKGVDTIFMGGGTPSLLSAPDLDKLCEAIRAAAGNRVLEWTIECAPGTIKKDKMEVLKRWGVNRFSLGVQSFNDKTLAAIGRPHTLKQIYEAIELIKDSAENWNMDLIFAAADNTLAQWMEDLESAIKMGSPHLSTYCLTFESDTQMYLKMLRGGKKRPSAEEEAVFYKKTWEVLQQEGFNHYEVANFARPGSECQHNLNTWKMQEWLGYGPAAASQKYVGHKAASQGERASISTTQRGYGAAGPNNNPRPEGGGRGWECSNDSVKRYTNIPNLKQWAEGVWKGQRNFVDESTLTTEELALDALVFGLRMPEGVSIKEIKNNVLPQTARGLENLAYEWTKQGLMQSQNDSWALTEDGLLLADKIGEEILSLEEK